MSHFGHYTQLFEAVHACRPKRILEVGTWDGAHAAQMIQIAQFFCRFVEYYGFDLFAPAPDYERAKSAPPRAEVERKLKETGAQIRLFEGDTRVTFPAVVAELPQMDFVFIDGGHSVETIASDWRCVQQLMHHDTVVLFDDYYPDEPSSGCKSLVDALGGVYQVTVGPVTEYPQMRVCMATVRLK